MGIQIVLDTNTHKNYFSINANTDVELPIVTRSEQESNTIVHVVTNEEDAVLLKTHIQMALVQFRMHKRKNK